MKYPLLPYSRLVWEMTRWMPGIYRFPFTFLWRNGAAEQERIVHAFRTALLNHPVFSSRVDWFGRQYPTTPRDILHGPYHDFTFYTQGKDLYVRISADRILGDGYSCFVLLQDIARAYEGLYLEEDDYWGYLARVERDKQSEHYQHSRDLLIREFADTSVPVRPTIDRRCLWTLLPPNAGLYENNYSDLLPPIRSLMRQSHLNMEGMFSLCTALAIADYCGTDHAALTWAYEGREMPEEQHVFGSLHRDVPFQIKKSQITNRETAIRAARNQIRSGIAHSDYPYTLTAPYTHRWNYAVNVLRIDDPEDMRRNIDLPIELVTIPIQKNAYAMLDVEMHEHTDSLALVYRYSATHYKESSIRRFAALVRKYVEWLLQ